jgi:succinate dehydrogenase/fumarate reductase flavoprotein subunit
MGNEQDLVIVGTGGGGLVAGLLARASGLDPLIIEKTEYLGGTTALSHGALWLPDNPLAKAAGLEDSVEAGVGYLQHVVGDQGPATTRVRQEAFVRGGDRAVRFLQRQGVQLRLIPNYPDYYPDAPGARTEGRMIAAPLLDARDLGDWQDLPRPRPPLPGGVVMSSVEQFLALLSVGFSWKSRAAVAKIVADSAKLKARGVKPLVMGQAYIGQLIRAAQAAGLRIQRNTALRELLVEEGRVVGVTAVTGGREITIGSRYGVLCNAGGYARNPGLRAQFGPKPASTNWTATIQADTGDAFLAATAIGATTTNLDKAYWLPGLLNQHGVSTIFVAERCVPHSILVDSSGARFSNEAQSYMQLGNEQYERHQTVPAIPAYLIIDARHRRRYSLGETLPGVPPRAWLASGHLKKAGSLRELAGQCGIDPDGLERTVARFNQMARAGVDSDFGRGSNAHDLVYADPGHGGPNPSLGTIEAAPFYAAKMMPTDVGMAGGLLTDEYARVIAENGTPIEGLYASGTTAASCMGDKYPGGGSSLAQSTAFGFIAAEQIIARASSRVDAAV